MFETVVLFSQILMLTALASWLSFGVWDNIMHPGNNEAFKAQVMGMTRMRDAYPDEFARVAHRAVESRALQQAAFRFVVLAELAATLVLWAGVVLLVSSLFGGAAMETARATAFLGATIFTCIWSGFLVVGNYFCYWFCHEWGQNTHFQMTMWGLGIMIFLVVA